MIGTASALDNNKTETAEICPFSVSLGMTAMLKGSTYILNDALLRCCRTDGKTFCIKKSWFDYFAIFVLKSHTVTAVADMIFITEIDIRGVSAQPL